MRTLHGELHDVLGRPATTGTMSFMPAVVALEGSAFSSDFRLVQHATAPPRVLLRPLAEGYDASWVRARLPRLFGFTPAVSEGEKSLLDVGMVAVLQPSAADPVGYPFVVTDYYGRSALMFGDPGPPASLQADIAARFWELLLEAPDDLSNFESRVYHHGAGIWLVFGCEAGNPYLLEEPEAPDEP